MASPKGNNNHQGVGRPVTPKVLFSDDHTSLPNIISRPVKKCGDEAQEHESRESENTAVLERSDVSKSHSPPSRGQRTFVCDGDSSRVTSVDDKATSTIQAVESLKGLGISMCSRDEDEVKPLHVQDRHRSDMATDLNPERQDFNYEPRFHESFRSLEPSTTSSFESDNNPASGLEISNALSEASGQVSQPSPSLGPIDRLDTDTAALIEYHGVEEQEPSRRVTPTLPTVSDVLPALLKTQPCRAVDPKSIELSAYLDDGQSIRTVNTDQATYVSSALSSDQISLFAETADMTSEEEECKTDEDEATTAADQRAVGESAPARGHFEAQLVTPHNTTRFNAERYWDPTMKPRLNAQSEGKDRLSLTDSSSVTSGTKTSSFSTTGSLSPSQGPLRSVEAVIDLPSLTRQRRARKESSLSSEFSIRALSPCASTQAGPSNYLLSGPSNLCPLHNFESVQSLSPSRPETLSPKKEIISSNMSDPSDDEPMYLRVPPKNKGKKAKTRSTKPKAYLPEDFDTSSSSSSEAKSIAPRLDKGKGKAKEVDSDDEGAQQFDRQALDQESPSGPEFKYEDLFEDIPYESSDDPYQTNHYFLSPAGSPPVVPMPPLPIKTVPIFIPGQKDTKIAEEPPRTSSQISNDGSYASEMSKVAMLFDPEDDTDISAFLRTTKDMDYGTNNPTGTSTQNTMRKRVTDPVVAKKKNRLPTIPETNAHDLIKSRLRKMAISLPSSQQRIGQPSTTIKGSRRSKGFGVRGFTGVKLSNGDRIGRAQQLIRYEDNLPVPNTVSFTDRLPRLHRGVATESAVRRRIEVANDEWNRLKHECPVFPLREEHLAVPHPVKGGRMKCERLERLAGGEWLEQAYCSHHHRAEFSATPRLARSVLVEEREEEHHGAVRLLVVVGCLFVLALVASVWAIAH